LPDIEVPPRYNLLHQANTWLAEKIGAHHAPFSNGAETKCSQPPDVISSYKHTLLKIFEFTPGSRQVFVSFQNFNPCLIRESIEMKAVSFGVF